MSKTKRCAISFFYDPDGVLDDYMVFLLTSMRPFVEKLMFVVNGELDAPSRAKIALIVDEIVIRENAGFDVWAYKTGLERLWASGERFDEVLMFNHTFYGPLFPFEQMFAAIEATPCDFWGVTAHKRETQSTPAGERVVPFHLNSHFIAVREPMLSSQPHRDYWRDMEPIGSYFASIEKHELRFTEFFQAQGYRCASYVDPDAFGAPYAAFMEIDATIAAGSPVLKRRAFFHDPAFLIERGVDLPRALRLVREKTDYDTSLIWRNILRSTQARTLQANCALMRILPDLPPTAPPPALKVAVCVHVHYDEMIEEILDLAAYLPIRHDLIVTTATQAKRRRVEEAAERRKKAGQNIGEIIVRMCEQRGRDMSALLVACADLFAGDAYDLVCRLHTKKSPQVDSSMGAFFKRFVMECNLSSPGYAAQVLDLFAREPCLGVLTPPMIHITTPTLGHAWFVNFDNAVALKERLGLKVPLDDNPPVAVYGGMYWFRPKALRILFAAGFSYADFTPEPLPVDGVLSHALERIVVYVAQDAGYYTMTAAPARHAEHSYVALEHKANALTRLLPTGDFRRQVELMTQLQPMLRAAHLGDKEIGAVGEAEARVLRRHARAARISAVRAERRRDFALARVKRLQERSSRFSARVMGRAVFAAEEKRVSAYLAELAARAGAHVPDAAAIRAYLETGECEGERLTPFFDGAFYIEENEDVATRRGSALVHFLVHGWAEGRAPHPLVDLRFIRQTAPGLCDVGALPLAALLDRATRASFSSHPLIDYDFYLSQIPEGLGGMSPAAHYMAQGAAAMLDPHPLFNTRGYLAQAPHLQAAGLDPLTHFLRHGALEGLSPSPEFDAAWYLQAYGDVFESGVNPLVHYVTVGIHEGRRRRP